MNAKLAARNVSRVVTREESGRGQQGDAVGSLGAGNAGTMFPIIGASGTVGTTVEGGALAAQAAVGGTGCTDPLKQYTATRFEYAKNGEAVTYAMGEQWCSDGVSACEQGGSYKVTYAREFRYDGARARYMNAPLNPATMVPYNTTQKPTVWSDYDGDEIYGDFEMANGSPVNKRSFDPGIARTANPLTTPVTNYYHGDMLGTTRLMSNPSGSSIEPAVYTAFGERIFAPTITDATRYGYVGAWGYEQNADFPYLHVGARYYDPSSGRFLQRDPIGIRGGKNVYQYARGIPTLRIDPLGLSVGLLPGPPKKPWDPGVPRQPGPNPRPPPQPAPPPSPPPSDDDDDSDIPPGWDPFDTASIAFW